MFGWFRKQKAQQPSGSLTGLLNLPDAKFVDAVSGLIAQAAPAEHAMTIVAHYNLGPMVAAVTSVMAREKKPYDEEEILQQLLAKDMSDPVSGRRLWWFCSGYLVRRLDRIAAKNPVHTPAASQVWSTLVEGSQFVPALLKNNVVWSQSEKDLVLMSMSRTGTSEPTPREAMLFTLRTMVPKSYQRALEVERVVEKCGLTYFGP